MTQSTAFDKALDFSGKTVLVTGSSRGIGAGILAALGRRGARCIVNYFEDPEGRNRADAQAVAKEIGTSAALVSCDISKAHEVAKMAETIKRDFGGLDILVNNAGILRDRSMRKMTLEDFQSVINVNLGGTFNVIHKLSEHIRSGGRIVQHGIGRGDPRVLRASQLRAEQSGSHRPDESRRARVGAKSDHRECDRARRHRD